MKGQRPLKYCRSCFAAIPTETEHCPHCGEVQFIRKPRKAKP